MVSFSQIFFLPVRDNGEALLWCGHTVRKVLLVFAVWDRRRYCKALCDVKFSQIEGNGREFSHKEISNSVINKKC